MTNFAALRAAIEEGCRVYDNLVHLPYAPASPTSATADRRRILTARPTRANRRCTTLAYETDCNMTAQDGQPDVLVVGAGPTGLTLAAQLQAIGTSIRIVDRQPDRVRESRALAMQPRRLEVL